MAGVWAPYCARIQADNDLLVQLSDRGLDGGSPGSMRDVCERAEQAPRCGRQRIMRERRVGAMLFPARRLTWRAGRRSRRDEEVRADYSSSAFGLYAATICCCTCGGTG